MAYGDHITELAIIDGHTTTFESVSWHSAYGDAEKGRRATVVTRAQIVGLEPVNVQHHFTGPASPMESSYSYVGRVLIVRYSSRHGRTVYTGEPT